MPSTGLVERVNRLASRAARLPRGFRADNVWRALDALLLEDRILLSAAPIDTAVIDTLAEAGAEADLAEAATGDLQVETDAFYEVAFVDPSAGDAQQFLTDLAEQIEAGRQIEVVLLDAGRDGLEQITEVLLARAAEGLPELDAVHIIAHGNERSVRLGSEWLRVDGFETRLDALSAWDAALADGGDVLFYSCDLAATEAGQAMLQTMSLAIGGDVAASTNDTGAASLGGNWTLEFSTGTIEASLAVSTDAQVSYEGLLATFTVTNTTNSGDGSLRKAIQDANANPGADIIDFNVPLNDGGHVYYRDDGIVGSLSLVAVTTLANGSIADFDPDYPAAPYSWYSISLSSALPAITDSVTIDGRTQPGFDLYPIIELDGNGLGAHGLDIRAGGTTIQGLVINQFSGSGIQITSGDGNVIQGNFIGTDVSGTIDRGNLVDGIDIRTDNNTIGGTTALARNIISGNQDDGINLDSASGNVILGNYIGVDVTGTRLLGNSSDGVLLELGANSNVIGGIGAGEGNVIAGNGGDGVSIVGTNVGNAIRGNSIYSNAGLGIDLENNGVTANDAGDVDGGANSQQNFPIITAVLTNASMTSISGTLHSTAAGTFELDFYASGAADGSGHGEGQTYLGSSTITTDGSGNGSFTIVLSSGVGSGAVITSTATDASGNTSEFSATFTAVSANNPPVLDNTGGMTLTDVAEDDANPAGDTVAAILASAGGDRITDADAGAVEGIAVVGVDDTNGQWQYNVGSGWTALGAVSDSSAVLLDSTARIRFVPNANYNGSAGSITFRAWDQTDGNASGDTAVDVSLNGGMTAYSTAVETATLFVTAVNDAPVLDNTGTMTLTDISEDDTASAGDTVSSIIASAGGDRITDADSGAVEGIAVAGVDNTNGQWQYNTGSGWVAFGAISGNNATLLDASARIRFVPSTNYNGPAGDITFRAWDLSDGNASGATGVDVSTGGGTTAYSATTETATLSVTAVNDAPVHSVPGAQTTSEDTPLTFSTANGNAVSIADVDAGANSIEVSLSVTNGRLTLGQTTGLVFSNGDGTADAAVTFTGSLSNVNAALDGLIYDPNPNYSGPDSLSIVTSDLGHSGGGPLLDADVVAITVTFVGTQPVAQSDSVRLFAAPSLFVPAPGVLANDADVDGQPLSAVLVAAPKNGSVALNADGSFTYTPTPGFFGYDTFRYASHDGILPSAPATVTVLVVPGIVTPPSGGGGGGGGDTDDGGDDFAGTSPDGGQLDAGEQDEGEDDSSSATEQYVGVSPDGGSPAPRRFARLLGGDMAPVAADGAPEDLLAESLLLKTAQFDGDATGVFRTASLLGGPTAGGAGLAGVAGSYTTLAALSDALQFDAGVLFERLDDLEDAIDEHGQTLEWIVGSAAATTTALATGYIFWLVRGGYLFAGLLSSMPAWYRFDPLPVLQSGGALLQPAAKNEDDSLEELLGEQRQRVRSKVPGEPGTAIDPAEADAT